MEQMDFKQTEALLKKYQLPFLASKFCQTKKQALAFAGKIGYPVVLKISSPEIVHKTDVGGVRLDIKDGKELARAFEEILNSVKKKKPKARIRGVLVQKQMISKEGRMVMVGMKKDISFGPVVIFGLGGVLVEVLNDVALRIAPISKIEAKKMIEAIKGYPLLKGYRGQKPVNLEKIAEMIVKISQLVLKEKKIKEIDFNPIWVDGEQALIIDACFLI